MDIYFIEITSETKNKLHLKKIQHEVSRFFLKKILKEKYRINSVIKEENGKPFLADNSMCFSISHSENFAGIAFDEGKIGFDMEFVKQRKFDGILKHFKISKNNVSEKEFYQIWTRYEAEYKSGGVNNFLTNFVYNNYVCSVSSENKGLPNFYKTTVKHVSDYDMCVFEKIDKNNIKFLPHSDINIKIK